MADEILIEYRVNVDGLKANLKTVQEELKTTETVGINSAKKTEDAFKKTGTATESLQTQLKKLKAQLAAATDPKEIERLARATGKLKDQMEDAGEAAKVFSSESKFEQMSTALGGVVGKLRNLDFKGAADQAKLLSGVAKTLTFKETIQSVKDLGSTFLNVAKSILTNPFILTLSAIAAVAYAVKQYSDSLKENTAVIEENNAAILKITENTRKLQKEYEDSVQKRLLADGALSENDIKKNAAREKYAELEKQQQKDLIEAAKKYSEEIGVNDAMTIEAKLRKQGELRARLKELATSQAKELSIAAKQLNEEIALIDKSAYDEKAAKDKAAKDKELADAIAAQKKENDELFKLIQDNLKETVQAESDAIDKGIKEYEAKNEAIKKNEKELAEFRKAQGEYEFEQNAKRVADAIKQEQEKKKAIEQLQIDLIGVTGSLFSSYAQIKQNEIDQEIINSNDLADAQIADIERTFNAGLISKQDYEAKKDVINKDAAEKEKQLKIKAFELQKQASLIQAVIATAQGVATALTGDPYTVLARVAIAAAIGAAQIAIIESQPTPKFEKGGEVNGKRHSQGGVIIEAEDKEFVVRRNEAIKNNSLLKAVNSGKTDQYIFENYIAPALKAQQRKFAEGKDASFANNIANSILLNGSFKDKNLLESLKQSRKNDRDIAIYLAKELKGSLYNPRKW